MLSIRIIPVLLLRNECLVKTINFNQFSYIGDPCNTVRIFNELEVDELIYQDIDSLSEAVMSKGDHHIDQPCMACFDKNYITKEMNKEKIKELEEMRIQDRNGK